MYVKLTYFVVIAMASRGSHFRSVLPQARPNRLAAINALLIACARASLSVLANFDTRYK